MKLALVASISVMIGTAPALARCSDEGVIAVRDVAVIDATRGPPKPGQTVLVREGRITAVGPTDRVAVSADARIVDGRGRFLIPGLWDMHVHLGDATEAALPLFVAFGVTGVRDMGSEGFESLRRWRVEALSGARVGPRIVAAGRILDGGTYPANRLIVRGEAEARRAVDSLAAAGVDFIKVHEHLDRDSYFGAAAEARKLGIPFAGHVPAKDDAMVVTGIEAADAGQRCFEHLNFLPFADDGPLQALLTALRKNRTWVTPTLSVYSVMARRGEPDVKNDPRAKYVAQGLKRHWDEQRAGWANGPGPDFYRKFLRRKLDGVRSLRDAAVPLLAGTDVGFPDVYPGSGLHDELEHLVEAGLTPGEALRAATCDAARYLERDRDLGTVETGKRADLVLLDANPLDDIRNTRGIRAVLMNGRLFDRADLDRLLTDVARAVDRP
jgi:imidazolonepropionase-like amidohydrolase